ncbi:hypothetical protein [Actinoplanes sp. NPDC049118]|uniref:hypothetical protein n=1 Tax=Actinoplanes sp. NPDC049118 TaxID=3155769 RepID=UPI0033E303DA
MKARIARVGAAFVMISVILTASPATAVPRTAPGRAQASLAEVRAGWYYLWRSGSPQQGHPRVDNAGGIAGLRLGFSHAYVWPHQGHDPLWIYYRVNYSNLGDRILYFTCQGVTDPTISGEWLKRSNGTIAGYVGGERSYCGQHPNANFTLGPGRAMTVWVLVHNVPWPGDKISLEWQRGSRLPVRTEWFPPYADGPYTRPAPPRDVCPYDCS